MVGNKREIVRNLTKKKKKRDQYKYDSVLGIGDSVVWTGDKVDSLHDEQPNNIP